MEKTMINKFSLSLVIGVAASGLGMAQQAPATPPASLNAPSNPGNNSSPAAAVPSPGANSFTETQAKSRLEDQGFAGVTGLKKDAEGIWRGTAVKDGRSVSVGVDYQGTIVQR